MRLVVSLNPNGDGVEKALHISVFWGIMRGMWDPILKWPFDEDVKIGLINQNNEERAFLVQCKHLTKKELHLNDLIKNRTRKLVIKSLRLIKLLMGWICERWHCIIEM